MVEKKKSWLKEADYRLMGIDISIQRAEGWSDLSLYTEEKSTSHTAGGVSVHLGAVV